MLNTVARRGDTDGVIDVLGVHDGVMEGEAEKEGVTLGEADADGVTVGVGDAGATQRSQVPPELMEYLPIPTEALLQHDSMPARGGRKAGRGIEKRSGEGSDKEGINTSEEPANTPPQGKAGVRWTTRPHYSLHAPYTVRLCSPYVRSAWAVKTWSDSTSANETKKDRERVKERETGESKAQESATGQLARWAARCGGWAWSRYSPLAVQSKGRPST